MASDPGPGRCRGCTASLSRGTVVTCGGCYSRQHLKCFSSPGIHMTPREENENRSLLTRTGLLILCRGCAAVTRANHIKPQVQPQPQPKSQLKPLPTVLPAALPIPTPLPTALSTPLPTPMLQPTNNNPSDNSPSNDLKPDPPSVHRHNAFSTITPATLNTSAAGPPAAIDAPSTPQLSYAQVAGLAAQLKNLIREVGELKKHQQIPHPSKSNQALPPQPSAPQPSAYQPSPPSSPPAASSDRHRTVYVRGLEECAGVDDGPRVAALLQQAGLNCYGHCIHRRVGQEGRGPGPRPLLLTLPTSAWARALILAGSGLRASTAYQDVFLSAPRSEKERHADYTNRQLARRLNSQNDGYHYYLTRLSFELARGHRVQSDTGIIEFVRDRIWKAPSPLPNPAPTPAATSLTTAPPATAPTANVPTAPTPAAPTPAPTPTATAPTSPATTTPSYTAHAPVAPVPTVAAPGALSLAPPAPAPAPTIPAPGAPTPAPTPTATAPTSPATTTPSYTAPAPVAPVPTVAAPGALSLAPPAPAPAPTIPAPGASAPGTVTPPTPAASATLRIPTPPTSKNCEAPPDEKNATPPIVAGE